MRVFSVTADYDLILMAAALFLRILYNNEKKEKALGPYAPLEIEQIEA